MSQPLYQTVYEAILQRIAGGDYGPGVMLPSEFDLADDLNVSQGTARKALMMLEQDGIVQRKQGRGTFVTLRTPETALFHFFRMRDHSDQQVVPVLEWETVTRRAATPEEHGRLHNSPAEVFEIARRRSFRGNPMSLEWCVVPAGLFPGLADRTPLQNTLYVLFQQAYSCVVMTAEERLSVGLLGDEHGAMLDLDPMTPVMIAHREARDLLDRVVELRRCIYLTEDMYYSVEMS
ncbi:MAG: GntR family transcriptional regulator [Paracoccaceae bacterium]